MKQQQLALPLGWRDGGRFADYHAGHSNAASVAQLRQALQAGDQALLLHGPAGVGKTHLLLAALAEYPGRGRYLALQRPAAEAVGLLLSAADCSLLCLDDVDRQLGEREVEVALFDAYNQVRDRQGCVLLSACQRPTREQFALPDLASRLLGATSLPLCALDDTELAAAWQARARQRGLDPDPAAVDWLLRHRRRDFHSLIEALDRLDEAALAARRRLSLPFVRGLLGEAVNESGPSGQAQD